MASKLFGSRGPKVPHLSMAGASGVKGELADLRADVDATLEDLEDNGGRLYLDEFTNLAAADTDGIKLAAASSDSIQTFTTDDFDGVVGDGEMTPPRNVTITTSTHADIDAVVVTVTGYVRDENGDLVAQTDSITLTNGGGATNAGTKAFSTVTGVSIPAQSGAGGTVAIGFGTVVGLTKKIRSAAGYVMRVMQVTAGALVTNGTFVAAETATPNGTWAPNTAADDANDYAILYVTQ